MKITKLHIVLLVISSISNTILAQAISTDYGKSFPYYINANEPTLQATFEINDLASTASSMSMGKPYDIDEAVASSKMLIASTDELTEEFPLENTSSSDINLEVQAAIVVRGPYLQKGTTSSMVVRWRTDTDTESVIEYGTAPGNLNMTALDLNAKTEHEIEITGLTDNTIYYYQISNSSEVLIAGASDMYFKTHPAIGTSESYSFWVLGDAGTANANQRAVRDAYYYYTGSDIVDGILFLGDNAYDDGKDSEYQEAIFDVYDDRLKNTVSWSTLGNHDGHQADSESQTGPYYDIFTFPKLGESGGMASGTEAYYSFDYGNLHFIVLESHETDRTVGSAMYNWAMSDIQNTAQEWIIAFWHHPPYSKGSHDSDSENELEEMRQNFVPMLESNGVDLVLSGHSHSYERSYLLNGHYGVSSTFDSQVHTIGLNGDGDGKIEGTGAYAKVSGGIDSGKGAVYIVAGSSGKVQGVSNHDAMAVSLSQLGSCIISVDGNELNVKFIRETGEIADYFTIQKTCATTGCDNVDGPSISIDDVTASEGDGSLVFTVSLSDVSDRELTVDYSTANGSALHPDDFTFTLGTLSIPIGSISGTISVPLVDDVLPESDETFNLFLNNSINANIEDNLGVGRIQNNDVLPVLASVSFQDGVNGYSDTRDARLLSSSPDTGYGNEVELGADGKPDESSLIYWNLSSIPVGSNIQSADITLDVTNVSDDDYEIYQTKRRWIENEVTWNESVNGQSWDVEGADGSTDRGSTVLGVFSGSSTGVKIVSLNTYGVSMVQQWVDDPASNYGILLMDYTNATDGLDLSSRESNDNVDHPKISITYAEPTITLFSPNGGEEWKAGSSQEITWGSLNIFDNLNIEYSADNGITWSMIAANTPDDGSHTWVIPDNPSTTILVRASNLNGTASDQSDGVLSITLIIVPDVTIDDVTVIEGNSGSIEAIFTISLSEATSQTVSVNYSTNDVTTSSANDYTSVSGQLVFLPGELSQTITVQVNGDVSEESIESFTVDLSNAANAVITDNQGIGTIIDDDATPSISIDDFMAAEDAANLIFTISLTSVSGEIISMDYSTTDGTATSPEDYTSSSGTFSIPAGLTSGIIAVTFPDDVLNEADETFTLDLSNPANAVIADDQGIGTIIDDDATPSLSVDDVNISENEGALTFTVSLSAISGQEVSVDYSTTDGSAVAIEDYTNLSGTLDIPAGTISGTVSIAILDDLASEGSESFALDLNNPINASISDNQGLGTISDDDAPSLSINDVSISEGVGTFVFTATLSGISEQAVTIDYSTNDGTAVSPDDYLPTSGTLSIPAGSTSGTISVPIEDDVTSEDAESFTLDLSNPFNAILIDNQGVGTIRNNDVVPVNVAYSFQDGVNGYNSTRDTRIYSDSPNTNYGDDNLMGADGKPDESSLIYWNISSIPSGSNIQSVEITLDVTNASDDGYEIFRLNRDWIESEASWNEYASGQNWDMAGANGTSDKGPIVLGAFLGSSTGKKTISLNADGVSVVQSWVDDPSSNFGIIISDYTNATDGLDLSTRDANNADDHPKITISYAEPAITIFSPNGGEQWEVGSTQEIVWGSTNNLDNVNIDYSVDNGSSWFMIAANTPDDGVETWIVPNTPSDNILVRVRSINGSTSDQSDGNYSINTPVIPDISIDDVILSEGNNGTLNATFTVRFSEPTSQTVSVDYATSDVTATSNVDYNSISLGTLIFNPGITSQTISVVVNSDIIDEPDETFSVTLSNAPLGFITDNQGIGTITDDDIAPTLSVNDITENENVNNLMFTVGLSAVSGKEISVDYTSAIDAAISPDDFTSTSGTLNIPAGAASGTVIVQIIDDALYEAEESFVLNLSNPINASIVDNQGIGTITDNDAPPSLTIDDIDVNEDAATMMFTVSLSVVSGQDLSVDYSTTDISAISPDDFVASSGALNIPAGTTAGTISVTIFDDALYETEESFSVNLSNPVNASIADNMGIGTMADNDAAPSLTINDVGIIEDAATMVFTISLSEVSGQDLSVDYSTTDISAVSPQDFTASTGTLNILAGETSGTVSITINDDVLDEAGESLTLDLSNPVNSTIADNQAIGSITDNDTAPSIMIDDVGEDENAGTMMFTVSLSSVSGQVVSVDYNSADVTAISSEDFVPLSGTLDIPAGSMSGTISVSITDDIIDELVETFTINLSNPVNASIGDNQGTGTITDNDAAPSISINDEDVTEDAGTMIFTVSLSVVSGKIVTVDFNTTDGSAVSPEDFIFASGTVIIPAGSISEPISIVIADNLVTETTENFTIDLNNPINASISDNQGLGTITDNDAVQNLSIDNVNASEDAGTLVFTVSLSDVSGQNISVDYATTNGSASSPADFSSTAGTINIPAGTISETISIPIVEDLLDESSETFTILLSNPINAGITDNQGVGTIADNDNTPSLSINDVNVNEDAGTIMFTVNLSAISGLSVGLDYSTADVSANSPADFTSVSGTLIIPAGSASEAISVAIIDDFFSEGTETFTLNMINPVNATILDNSGVGTIMDNDVLQSLTINDVSVSEDVGSLIFTVSLSDISPLPVSVDYNSSNGTAISPDDFTTVSGTLIIPSGSTSGEISINIANDLSGETTEIFTMDLSNPVNASIGDNQGVGTITDDDVIQSLSVNDVSAEEGVGVLIFTVSLSAIDGQVITVDYATADGSASSPNDYTAVSGTLSIPAGSVSSTISVPLNDDILSENSENFTLSLSNPVNAIITDNQGLGTISDNDIVSNTVTISFQDGANGYSGTRDTKLHSSSANTNYGNTNELGADGKPDESSLVYWNLISIPPGSDIQSVDITFDVAGKSVHEYEFYDLKQAWVEDEATWNEYASGQNWQIPGADGTADRNSTVIGSITPPTTGIYTIPLNSAGLAAVQSWVDDPSSNHGIMIMDYLDATDGLDISSRETNNVADRPKITITYVEAVITLFTPNGGEQWEIGSTQEVTWSSGNISDNLNIEYSADNGGTWSMIAANTPDDGSETWIIPNIPTNNLLVRVGSINGSPSDQSNGVSAITSPIIPLITINDVLVNEGNNGTVNATFTVVLSEPTSQTVAIDYATSDGTATSFGDYNTVLLNTLTFFPGATSLPISVVVNGDILDEPDETFTINLSNPVNASISDNQGVGTITDDDVTPSLAIDDVSVSENAGSLIFTVSLSAISGQVVSVDYSTADGTAVSPADYTATSGTLNIAAGTNSGTVSVPIVDDLVSEGAETFSLDLINPVNASISDNQGVGTITDNEGVPSLTIDDVLVTEGNVGTVNAVFTATLSLVSAQTITVDYSTSNGSATSPEDYAALPLSTLSFAPGTTSQTITVVTNGDILDEPDETFTINLINPVNASISDNQGVGTITDDDVAPSLAIDDVSVSENAGSLIFTVSLSAIRGQVVSVDYSTADGTAVSPADYTATSGTLNIAAGSISGTISVPVTDDILDEPDETFTLDLSNPVNASISDNQGIGTIIDDDVVSVPVTVSFQDGVNGYSGTRDTKLMSDSPTTNYGSDDKLGADGQPDESALVYWNLTNIPVGSTIQSVDITFDVTGKSVAEYEFYSLQRAWVENEANWNEAASGQNWEIPGADGTADRNSTVIGSITAPTTGSYTIPLNSAGLAVVQSWVDDPTSNYGIIIVDYINATDGLDLSSRETNVVADRPKITVNYINSSNNIARKSNSNIEIGEVESGNDPLKESISLISIYPNPIKTKTTIEYTLHIDLKVQITICNLEGRIIRNLKTEIQTAGEKSIVWNGKDDKGILVKSGNYFMQLYAGETRIIRKLILLK